MRRSYTSRRFGPGTLGIIGMADAICREYAQAGYDLTLRQLYYQFVARGLIPNLQSEYKRLGGIVNDARLAGLIDWDHLTDRTRHVLGGDAAPITPADAFRMAAERYAIPLWAASPVRVEVWVEKEALAGIVARAAGPWRVEHFSCRGYVSQSEMHAAAQRVEAKLANAERVVILHLGDHDPSGIDMTRDIRDRLSLFLGGDGYDPGRLTVDRIALNLDQVREHRPPPNPAKLTDSRVGDYLRRFGPESWELDALDPGTLADLIQDRILDAMGDYGATWDERVAEEERIRADMIQVAQALDAA